MFEHGSDQGADAAKSQEAEKCDAVGDSAVEDNTRDPGDCVGTDSDQQIEPKQTLENQDQELAIDPLPTPLVKS